MKLITLLIVLIPLNISAQSNPIEAYTDFKAQAKSEFLSFRDSANQRYTEFLREAWVWYEGKAPLPLPKDNPIPPRPFQQNDERTNAEITPIETKPVEDNGQPMPIEPIPEVHSSESDYFNISFYGITPRIRLPETAKHKLKDCSPTSIAKAWERLCSDEMNNAIRDCIETRLRYNLCDWAYLSFLDELGRQFCSDSNSATLLTAFLYCQSGYQMRLAEDRDRLKMLYGSRHQIFDKSYFELSGSYFYCLTEPSERMRICNIEFESEKPLSLYISKAQDLGEKLSAKRKIESKSQKKIIAESNVPEHLIKFYNSYPSSIINGNPMTRWAMYATTPLAQKTMDILYPDLKEAINGLSKLEAANILLNWVQTGFVYEYDDKVWGADRAFFAEETLYYPYCDCEDRSILYSRLVRDLLRLDVALIYYPGHLATAVCFNDDVEGDTMLINGRRFIVCDPTYIGAPVGAQMPDLEYDRAMAIIL